MNWVLSVDLNALAWLEDYLQTWPGTLLVVYVLNVLTLVDADPLYLSSHDRAFLCVDAIFVISCH